jgi:hypothetical protein
MFGGSQSATGMTCEGYWKQLTIAFKYLLVSTLGLAVLGLFTPKIAYLFANMIEQTVNHLQVWRLVTSFLANFSLITLLFDLLIMSSFLPDLVSKSLLRKGGTPQPTCSQKSSFRTSIAILPLSFLERRFPY